MKVTIKEKQEEKNQGVPFDEIPNGYIYVVGADDGPIALKLGGNNAVLLSYSDKNINWFVIADRYKGSPAYKILGKLTEIIVEEE